MPDSDPAIIPEALRRANEERIKFAALQKIHHKAKCAKVWASDAQPSHLVDVMNRHVCPDDRRNGGAAPVHSPASLFYEEMCYLNERRFVNEHALKRYSAKTGRLLTEGEVGQLASWADKEFIRDFPEGFLQSGALVVGKWEVNVVSEGAEAGNVVARNPKNSVGKVTEAGVFDRGGEEGASEPAPEEEAPPGEKRSANSASRETFFRKNESLDALLAERFGCDRQQFVVMAWSAALYKWVEVWEAVVSKRDSGALAAGAAAASVHLPGRTTAAPVTTGGPVGGETPSEMNPLEESPVETAQTEKPKSVWGKPDQGAGAAGTLSWADRAKAASARETPQSGLTKTGGKGKGKGVSDGGADGTSAGVSASEPGPADGITTQEHPRHQTHQPDATGVVDAPVSSSSTTPDQPTGQPAASSTIPDQPAATGQPDVLATGTPLATSDITNPLFLSSVPADFDKLLLFPNAADRDTFLKDWRRLTQSLTLTYNRDLEKAGGDGPTTYDGQITCDKSLPLSGWIKAICEQEIAALEVEEKKLVAEEAAEKKQSSAVAPDQEAQPKGPPQLPFLEQDGAAAPSSPNSPLNGSSSTFNYSTALVALPEPKLTLAQLRSRLTLFKKFLAKPGSLNVTKHKNSPNKLAHEKSAFEHSLSENSSLFLQPSGLLPHVKVQIGQSARADQSWLQSFDPGSWTVETLREKIHAELVKKGVIIPGDRPKPEKPSDPQPRAVDNIRLCQYSGGAGPVSKLMKVLRDADSLKDLALGVKGAVGHPKIGHLKIWVLAEAEKVGLHPKIFGFEDQALVPARIVYLGTE